MASESIRTAAQNWVATYDAIHRDDRAPRGATIDRASGQVWVAGWPNTTCSQCGQDAPHRAFLPESQGGNALWSRQHTCGMTPRTCAGIVLTDAYTSAADVLEALDAVALDIEREVDEALAEMLAKTQAAVRTEATDAATALIGRTLTADEWGRITVDAGTDDECALRDVAPGWGAPGWDVQGRPPLGRSDVSVVSWRYHPDANCNDTVWVEVPLTLDGAGRVVSVYPLSVDPLSVE